MGIAEKIRDKNIVLALEMGQTLRGKSQYNAFTIPLLPDSTNNLHDVLSDVNYWLLYAFSL